MVTTWHLSSSTTQTPYTPIAGLSDQLSKPRHATIALRPRILSIAFLAFVQAESKDTSQGPLFAVGLRKTEERLL